MTFSEAIFLAGLTKAPSYLNPRRHFKRAKKRQQAIYDQQERRRKFIEISAVIFLALLSTGFIVWVIWMFMKTRGMI